MLIDPQHHHLLMTQAALAIRESRRMISLVRARKLTARTKVLTGNACRKFEQAHESLRALASARSEASYGALLISTT